MILFIEPYVAPAEVEEAFAAAGLDQYVNELDRNAPYPRSARSSARAAA